ncbi:hypothetical protein POM88_015082 [Heracleum sosnowskyi]|uniref:DUF4057 domain-containing protein n=1 Tax=Heracleum sosnowskyi TaxID=360622 RepID=A0AAD8IJ75_9APIA|nr:hypothetical protein POM88_015082 [Heracleum sosnowskyi]
MKRGIEERNEGRLRLQNWGFEYRAKLGLQNLSLEAYYSSKSSQAAWVKQSSDAKCKELSEHDIFCPPPEIPARKLTAAHNLELKANRDMEEPAPLRNLCTSVKVSYVDPLNSSESEEGGGLIAPQEAFNRFADVVQEAIKKMKMVEEEKLRMVKKARLAVEAYDQELKDKAREVVALKMDRQRKKQ